jgi:putative ABC transport system permease protein
MSLWRIAWRSVQQRLLASTLTGISMALGVALVIAVLVILGVVRDSFSHAAHGYNIIVGAKGGKLQLVLNTVYHLSTPIENIPWSYYKEFRQGKYAKQVELAIPYCLGDNYEGYRVVGTTPELFEKLEYAPGKHYEFAAGRNFKPREFFGAVVGSIVARKTGLRVGSQFQPTHGVETGGHKHDAFKVVGILAPTGTPNDRALFINLEGFFLIGDHARPEDRTAAAATGVELAPSASNNAFVPTATDLARFNPQLAIGNPQNGPRGGPVPEGTAENTSSPAGESEATHQHDHNHGPAGHHHHHHPLPESQREVTAILVRTRTPIDGLSLPRMVNKEPYAQAVLPVREIENLFSGIVGNVEWILLLLAGLIVVVAGIGIMVSIYNSMNDRRHDIAVMRALGARRTTVMSIILLESILLAVGGGLLGIVLGHGLVQALDPLIVNQTGVSIGLLQFEQIEFILIPLLVVLAAIVGFLPSLAAYRTDVAKALGDRP